MLTRDSSGCLSRQRATTITIVDDAGPVPCVDIAGAWGTGAAAALNDTATVQSGTQREEGL